jgi:hypothetical protein
MPLDATSIARWRATAEREIARSGLHTVAITQLSRAGAGDLADARALIAALRALPSPTSGGSDASVPEAPGIDAARERREALESQLSAALGRAQARADRGRVLAERGGDVTSLVALAPYEDTVVVARAAMSSRSRSRMLDTRPRRRVP